MQYENLCRGSQKWFAAQQEKNVYPNSGCSLIIQLILPSHSTIQDCLEFRSCTEIQKDETDVGVCMCVCVCVSGGI